jgi:ring-1,2-phenylacetyl-CoA epoxidase subunit PaaE
MSIHFHPITIKEIRKETNDCVSIAFNVPETLTDQFQFTQGQYINIKTKINGEEVRRSYSLCSSPLENEWRVAVKKVDGGLFSTYANEKLKAGDVVELMTPIGKFFTTLDASHQKSYLAFASGSGITPVLSIIKTTLQTEPKSSFTLIFGNKNHQSIIFKEALESLKNKYMGRFQLIHVLSRERTDATINHGRIDEKKMNEVSKLVDFKSIDEFFICGPEAMIFSIKHFLEEKNIDKKKIHFELFASKNGQQSIVHKSSQANDNSLKSKITVKLDGRSFDFNLSFNSDTILDAALQQGADLPFACKGGVCCTCKAKLLEGKVKMDVCYGLESEEIEQGFILTCQSHPITDKVVVDYDIK